MTAFTILMRISLMLSLILLLPNLTKSNGEPSPSRPKNWRLKLSEILSWSRFKQSFHKIYPSLREELARQKLFITNALRTFAHNIVFRWGKSSHYLSINSLADWTKKEVKALYNFRHNKLRKDENKIDDVVEDVMEDASLEEIQQELAKILEEKADGYETAAKNLEDKINDYHRRHKRMTTGQKRAMGRGMGKGQQWNKKHLDDKFESGTIDKPKESPKYVGVVPPTNPEYKPIKLKMRGSSAQQDEESPSLPDDYIETLETISGGSPVKDKFSSLLNWFNQAVTANKSNAEIDGDEDDEDDDDEDYDANSNDTPSGETHYLDYRDSGCLSIPRNQNDCGSCYAFATVSIMEWLHCNQTGKLVSFSEQYMIDCGFYTDLDGCDGGYIFGINKFSMDWGVELLENYPYMEKETECPYKQHEWHQAGYKKPTLRKSNKQDNRKLWPQVLKESGPMLISLSVPETFHLYGGGIHEGDNCNFGDEELHAMVLVGDGVEDGKEYWILRNSHGYQWGELGYFRLSKNAQDKCFDLGYEFVFDFVSEPQPATEVYDAATGKKRRLSPSEVQEKIYADIFLKGLTNL